MFIHVMLYAHMAFTCIYMHLHHIESANSLCLKAPPFASWRSCHRVERLKILTATRSTARRIRGWPQVQLTG